MGSSGGRAGLVTTDWSPSLRRTQFQRGHTRTSSGIGFRLAADYHLTLCRAVTTPHRPAIRHVIKLSNDTIPLSNDTIPVYHFAESRDPILAYCLPAAGRRATVGNAPPARHHRSELDQLSQRPLAGSNDGDRLIRSILASVRPRQRNECNARATEDLGGFPFDKRNQGCGG